MRYHHKDNDIARSWSWTWTLLSNRWKRDFQKWRVWKCNNAMKCVYSPCTPWDLLETCRHTLFFLCCPQLSGTRSFSFACWCQRVPPARSCSDPMYRLTVCGSLFFCRKLFCFPALVEIQAISACLQLGACPFRIFHRLASSFPCLIYKKDLSLQHLACPTCEPSLQADPKGGDSAICGLQLQAQVRFRHFSHLEMIWDDRRPWEIWTFQIQHLKCLQDDWFKSDLRLI